MKENLYNSNIPENSSMSHDLFKTLLEDDQWFDENQGKWVLIVNGEIMKIDESRDAVLNLASQDNEISGKNRFVSQVTRDEDVVDLPEVNTID